MSNIYVDSTTDDQQAVDQAATYEPAETSGTVTYTSTTEDQQTLDRSADHYDGDTVEQAPAQSEGEQSDGVHVDSTTDSKEAIAETKKDMRAEKERRPDWLTGRPSFRARMNRLYKQRDEALSAAEERQYENDALRAQLYRQPQAQQPQSAVLEEFRAAQARVAEEEKAFVQSHPDYPESVKKLRPGDESPIPPNSYYHLMLNIPNPVETGYYLSKHTDILNRLWFLESSGQTGQAMQELNQAAVKAARQQQRPETHACCGPGTLRPRHCSIFPMTSCSREC